MQLLKTKNVVWWVLGLWVILSAVVFIVYQQRYMKPLAVAIAQFEANDALRLLFKINDATTPSTKAIRVVYFWQAGCACDEFVKAHFIQMGKEYSGQDIDFMIANLSPEKPITDSYSHYSTLSLEQANAVRASVPMTPAVAIWSEQGELTYFGPHSLGVLCNDETSLIKKVIDSLLAGIVSQNISTVGSGCFCETPQ